MFPPTYMKERGATAAYAVEARVVDGTVDGETVLLDSVASPGQPHGGGVARGVEPAGARVPAGPRRLPHDNRRRPRGSRHAVGRCRRRTGSPTRSRRATRCSMARRSGRRPWAAITDARPDHAPPPMPRLRPTALVFGVWDSTGPGGRARGQVPSGRWSAGSSASAPSRVSGAREPSRSRVHESRSGRSRSRTIRRTPTSGWPTRRRRAARKAKRVHARRQGPQATPAARPRSTTATSRHDRQLRRRRLDRYALHTVVLSLPRARRGIRFAIRLPPARAWTTGRRATPPSSRRAPRSPPSAWPPSSTSTKRAICGRARSSSAPGRSRWRWWTATARSGRSRSIGTARGSSSATPPPRPPPTAWCGTRRPSI
ncbi:MAG: hypothetical protein HS111_13035 [Kofleriaceae bacterium]|nr:hypothetical protein [Kofleriaceae bacterium]